MKTRTLLLLSLACGLMIMVAGAVFFIQLANTDEAAPPIPIGDAAQVGDMSVTVTGSDESAGRLTVRVDIGGVADPDGASGFYVIAAGRRLVPVASDRTDPVDPVVACGSTAVEVRSCLLSFDTSSLDSTSRQLFYGRGDESARWVLA